MGARVRVVRVEIFLRVSDAGAGVAGRCAWRRGVGGWVGRLGGEVPLGDFGVEIYVEPWEC